MKRAQVYFDDDVYEAVRARAFKERTSMSSLLQQWAREKTIGTPKKKRYAAGLLELVGIAHETRSDVAERHDDYLWGDAE
jgi:hypothetical protein